MAQSHSKTGYFSIKRKNMITFNSILHSDSYKRYWRSKKNGLVYIYFFKWALIALTPHRINPYKSGSQPGEEFNPPLGNPFEEPVSQFISVNMKMRIQGKYTEMKWMKSIGHFLVCSVWHGSIGETLWNIPRWLNSNLWTLALKPNCLAAYRK